MDGGPCLSRSLHAEEDSTVVVVAAAADAEAAPSQPLEPPTVSLNIGLPLPLAQMQMSFLKTTHAESLMSVQALGSGVDLILEAMAALVAAMAAAVDAEHR